MIRAVAFLALTLCLSPVRAEDLASTKAAFAAADKVLNQAYQSAKAELPAWRFETVQQEQRDWLGYRDERALAAARFDGGAAEGTEESNPEYWNAMTYLTETRTEILEAWRKIDSFEDEWEGVWSDGYGGHLTILRNGDDTVTFAIQVVRGPTYHLGALGGTAIVNESMARFTITPEGSGEEVWLTFLRENGKLRVIGANTHYYHGARAYFDGEYLRLREVTDEDRKAAEELEFD